jgi:disulfide bond formation protein DsbB
LRLDRCGSFRYSPAMRDRLETRDPLTLAAASVAAICAATLGGAWVFQYGFDIRPCPLCLEQRYAYYLIIPLAALIALGRWRGAIGRPVAVAGLCIVALAALANAGLGSYHAGVEWGWWQGPTDCSGAPNFGSGSLLDRLNTVRVVRCDEVQWRFLGLSLAGYNVLISLAVAAIAVCGVVCSRKPG